MIRHALCMACCFSVLLAAGCETLDEPDSTTQTVNVFGKVVVLVIDNSAGPEEWDPRGYIREGSKFLLSTLNPEDNIGVVTCRFPAAVQARTQSVASDQGRTAMFQRIDQMEVGGESRLADALDLAGEMLQTFSDRDDSYVVFLTGGREKPVGEESQIHETLQRYGRNGWRIFPVVLAPSGHMPLLEKMAVSTRGAIFKVEKPEHLLTSLASVSAEINQRMIHRSLKKANALLPGAPSLLMAVTNRGEKTALSELRHGGKPLPLPGTGKGLNFKSEGYFHVVHVPEPKDGAYEAKVTGEAIDEFMFMETPFNVRMSTGGVGGTVKEGEAVRLALSLETEAKAVLKRVMEKARVRALVMSEQTGTTVSEVALTDFSLSGNRVEYEGGVRLVTSEPGKAETFTARVILTLEDEGLTWSLERYRSFLVKPASPLLFQVSPGAVDFGLLWADSRKVVETLTVSARAAQGLKVQVVDVSPGLTVEPAEALVAKDRPLYLTVALAGAQKPGPAKGTVRLKAFSATEGEMRFEKTVTVTYNVVTYRGSGDITLENVKPGETRRVDLEFATEPQIPLTIATGNLLGPAALPLAVEGEGPRRSLVLSVPENCVPGTYVGKVRVEAKGLGLAPREMKVTVRVKGESAAPTPTVEEKRPEVVADPVEMLLEAGGDGWVEGGLTLELAEGSPTAAVVAMERSALRGADDVEAISGEFDFITKPGPGWDGKEIVPARRVRLEYRVFVSADLPDGEYRGTVKIRYRGRGEKVYALEVPITVKVNRAGG